MIETVLPCSTDVVYAHVIYNNHGLGVCEFLTLLVQAMYHATCGPLEPTAVSEENGSCDQTTKVRAADLAVHK